MSTTTTAYGSITIVDITDIGEFSVKPESNKPITVICDPNQNPVKYTPSWTSENPLVLTPSVRYAGNSISISQLDSVEWRSRDGVGDWSQDPISSTKDDTYTNAQGTVVSVPVYVENNCLKVRDNILATSESKLITYKCTATYIEPITQHRLTATGEISFSLIENASQLKSCRIVGENVFLYNAQGTLTNPQLALTAQLTANINMGEWQYRDPLTQGWTPIAKPNANDKILSKLYVDGQNKRFGYADSNNNMEWTATYSNLFAAERLPLRAVSSDTSIYDDCTIVKLRDGRHGDSLVDIHLSNEDQVIPFHKDDNGQYVGNYTLATTLVSVYKGNEDVTSQWTISAPTAEDCVNVSGTWDGDKKEYKVTSLTSEVGYVIFRATDSDDNTLDKKFTLSQVKTGIDGTNPIIYSIEANTPSIRQSFTYGTNASGEQTVSAQYSHDTITFSAYVQEGNQTQSYVGDMYIYTDSQVMVKEGKKASEIAITINELSSNGYLTNLKYLTCVLFPQDSDTPLKTQTVLIVSDGAQGQQGADGAAGLDAINIVITNDGDQIPCYPDGKIRNDMNIIIPFTAYQGIKKTKCKMKITSTLPDGMSQSDVQKNSGVTAENGDGQLEISVTGGKTLGDQESGIITLLATCYGKDAEGKEESVDSIHTFRWIKNRQGERGTNSVSIQLEHPNGNYITDEDESLTFTASLLDGADIVSDITYKWLKHTVQSDKTVKYVEIVSDAQLHSISNDTKTLTIYRDAVSGYASYKCETTYNGNTYYSYFDVEDWVDELQANVYCTLGNQILNGYGQGAIYVKVTEKHKGELDPLKSNLFIVKDTPNLAELLGGATAYYELDPGDSETREGNRVTLKEYKNGEWTETPVVDAHTYQYNYSFRAMDGHILNDQDHNFSTAGKVIYVDGTLINKKVVIDVEVTKP